MIFKAACIQLNSNDDRNSNIAKAAILIRKAKAAGADLVITPENTDLMAPPKSLYRAQKFFQDEHPALKHFQALAKELDLWLVIGSLAIKVPDKEKLANRSFLIDNKGNISCYYDKIHLFDVTLSTQEEYKESSRCMPGNQAVVGDTPWGKLGMTICYDLRFPHLFRELAKRGAKCITVPAAFTQLTGEAHWHVLLRARAIETGCYIFAPAQTGTHPGNRHTYGHSVIVDPWGVVLTDGGYNEGIVMANIDLNMVDNIRRKLPSLHHDREFI